MGIGKLIRELRLNKKILAKDLYRNILTRAAVVKFEKGDSDTSSEKLFEILNRLNITLEEFFYLYFKKSYGDKMNLSPSEYMVAFYNRDLKMLEKISELSEIQYLKSGNIRYLHNKIISNTLMDSIMNKEHYSSESDTEIIKSYLINCDYWGYYELTLFINTLSFYSDEFIDITYKKTRAHLNTYNKLIRYRNEISILLLNILEKNFRSGNFTSAKSYYNELKKIKNTSLDNMYYQAMIAYFGKLLEYVEGEKEAEKEVNKIIEIFLFLEMKHKAIQCKHLYEDVKKFREW